MVIGSEMNKYPQQKIFCIGINKTGTTSIGDALKILGYRRLGWQDNISAALTLRWHEGKIERFVELSKKYDVFEDIPWCLVYKEMHALYPNAKFILTTRSTDEKWLNSICKHVKRNGRSNWIGHYLIYGSYNPEEDTQMYLNKYNSHNEEVREFFKDKPGKLLEMCFENGDSWKEICDFVGLDEIPEVEFPHSNPAKK